MPHTTLCPADAELPRTVILVVPMAACFRARILLATAAACLGAGLGRAKPILPQMVFGQQPARSAAGVNDAEGALGEPQFDSVPSPLPPNVAGIPFHITATSEIGDLVRLAGAAHLIDSVTVTLSSWAIRSDYPGSSELGFTHPITLKLYEVDRRSGQPRVGQLLARVDTPFLIPWRPEPDPTAPASPLRPWRASDGNYYGGLAFNLTFDLSAHSVALPDEVIASISFNTQDGGEAPLKKDGPYNALSVGVTAAPPVLGSRREPGAIFWKTSTGALYSDAGNTGVNVLRLDSGWGPYAPALRFNNSPYGALADLATRLMDLESANPLVNESLQEARKLATSVVERTLWENNREPRAMWGQLVFNLLAEIADELSVVARTRDRSASTAQEAVDSLVRVAHVLAEAAFADAIIANGNPTAIDSAQEAFDAAKNARQIGRADLSIDELGNAWREAQRAGR